MEYNPLVAINPAITNIREDSSAWLSARGLMPGKGNALVSAPSLDANMGSSVIDLTDFNFDGFYVINSQRELSNIVFVAGFYWFGCWHRIYSSPGIRPVLGIANSNGFYCPFNSFNIGYRVKKPTKNNPNGWRPSHVD